MGATDRVAVESQPASSPSPGKIEVDRWADALGGWIERHPGLMLRLAEWETRALVDRLADIPVSEPIYIAGLARSGSTILLELLGRHPDLATHRYRDFPPVLTPWFWNWFFDRAWSGSGEPQERAHKDRLKVTPESPEAFEEVVWMAFFRDLHAPGRDAVLDERTANPGFETFYRDHIRKIMLIRGRRRYLAKGNYNVTRLRYLLKLFPEARFVVPIREPAWHVASLMKQHALFCREQSRDPRILRYLSRAGHFEFGLGRRAVAIGGGDAWQEVERLWREGEEAAGWAQQWSLVYGHLARALDEDAGLREATLVVRYEDLCASPEATLGAILNHCRLATHDLPARAKATISAPDYYKPGFTEDEAISIRAHTAEVADRFGYR